MNSGKKKHNLNSFRVFDDYDNDTKSEISSKKNSDQIINNSDITYSENSETSETSSKKKKRKASSENKMKIKDAIKSFEENALFAKINRYFKKTCDKEDIEKMILIINENHEISLRLLNWFAMKYSSTIESLDIIRNNKKELFDVKISYNAQLKSHSKKYFDPFRRGTRFDYNYDINDKTKIIETTLCQLNFFMWIFSNKLMDYVEKNFKFLKEKMGNYEKKKKEIKKKEIKEKKKIVKKKKTIIKDNNKFNNNVSTKLVIVI